MFIKEQSIKNSPFFRGKKQTISSVVLRLFFGILLFPALVFGQGVFIQQYSVSSIDLWSTGVVLRAGTDRMSSQNVYRWFEFGVYEQLSASNSTPKKAHDGNAQYAEKITNLSPNTVYHYRPVVEVAGVKHYGEIQSFKTKKSGFGEPSGISDMGGYSYSGVGSYSYNQGSQNTGNANSSNAFYAASVVTKQADMIANTSARLNANISSSGTGNASGWFEWGNTSNPEKTTSRVFVGKGQNIYFNQVLTDIAPGQLYFFRPVIEDANGNKTKGLVFVFQTTGNSTNTTGNTSVASGGTSVNNTNATNSSDGKKTTAATSKPPVKTTPPKTTDTITNQQKTIAIKEAAQEETLAQGETVTKTVVFENTTGKDLNNVSVRIILPEKEEATNIVVRTTAPGGKTYVSEGSEACAQSGQILTCTIGKMQPGQKTEITYKTKVPNDIKDKTLLETVTTITGEDKDGEKFENIRTSASVIDVNKNSQKNAATAALFGGAHSIFPVTIKDWFFAILFIFLLMASYFGWRYYYEKKNEEDDDTLEISEYINAKEETPLPFFAASNDSPELSMKNMAFESVLAPVNEKGAPPPNLPI
ncbi:MAG: hypothetical protein WC878_00590 [Candidatus Paceibacterota bacterium]|jgi:hypothetical protein